MTLLTDLEPVFKRIENADNEHNYWIIGPKTGHMLYWLLRVLQPEVSLEIGTSVGYSAIWIASALEENKMGQLWTVESNEKRFNIAKVNIDESGLSHRILQVKGHAPEVFSNAPMPEVIDFAFFDATKEEHKSYFDVVFPRMVSGGMIVMDNVYSHRYKAMEEFIEKTYSNTGLKVVEIPVGDGLMIARVI